MPCHQRQRLCSVVGRPRSGGDLALSVGPACSSYSFLDQGCRVGVCVSQDHGPRGSYGLACRPLA